MCNIRVMSENDIKAVLEIESEAFSVPWTEKMFSEELMNKDVIYFLYEENEKILAYCGIMKTLDEGQIINIAVKKEYRRKGIGQKLIKKMIKWCREREIAVIELEVRESNISALKLYEKLGFVLVGKRKRYYKFPTEDAVLMDLRLKDG